MIYKTRSWKLMVEHHEHNKTPIIYKALHRKLMVEKDESHKTK
jgi:hypothetical protein